MHLSSDLQPFFRALGQQRMGYYVSSHLPPGHLQLEMAGDLLNAKDMLCHRPVTLPLTGIDLMWEWVVFLSSRLQTTALRL